MIIYSGEYHVDLPIYGTYQSETYLAEKSDDGWQKSDPIALKNWFNDVAKSEEQLRRLVRYMKSWCDFESRNGKMLSSLIITVLTVTNFITHNRDDACLANLLNNIKNSIQFSFDVYNPVDSSENLCDRITTSQKERFMNNISDFLIDATEALQEESKEKACKLWFKHFGDRYPSCCDLDKKNNVLITSAPALLKDDSRSAYDFFT